MFKMIENRRQFGFFRLHISIGLKCGEKTGTKICVIIQYKKFGYAIFLIRDSVVG